MENQIGKKHGFFLLARTGAEALGFCVCGWDMDPGRTFGVAIYDFLLGIISLLSVTLDGAASVRLNEAV